MHGIVGGLGGGAVGKERFFREREVIDDDVARRNRVRAQLADAGGEGFGRAAVRGKGERCAGCEIVNNLEHGAGPRRYRVAVPSASTATGVVWPSGVAGAGQVAAGHVIGGVRGERIAEGTLDGGIEAVRNDPHRDARAVVGGADGGSHVERGHSLRRSLADVAMRPADEGNGIHALQPRGGGGRVQRQPRAEHSHPAPRSTSWRAKTFAPSAARRAATVPGGAVPSRVTSATTARTTSSVWKAALCGKTPVERRAAAPASDRDGGCA